MNSILIFASGVFFGIASLMLTSYIINRILLIKAGGLAIPKEPKKIEKRCMNCRIKQYEDMMDIRCRNKKSKHYGTMVDDYSCCDRWKG